MNKKITFLAAMFNKNYPVLIINQNYWGMSVCSTKDYMNTQFRLSLYVDKTSMFSGTEVEYLKELAEKIDKKV